jgi:hypothetical protein
LGAIVTDGRGGRWAKIEVNSCAIMSDNEQSDDEQV